MGETIKTHQAARLFYGRAKDSAEDYSPGGCDWMTQGLCQYVDPDMFFPGKGGAAYEAKRICKECPVKDECRDWAVQRPGIDGIWGGLSERERMKLRVARGRG